MFISYLSRAKPAAATEPPTAPPTQIPFPHNRILAVNEAILSKENFLHLTHQI